MTSLFITGITMISLFITGITMTSLFVTGITMIRKLEQRNQINQGITKDQRSLILMSMSHQQDKKKVQLLLTNFYLQVIYFYLLAKTKYNANIYILTPSNCEIKSAEILISNIMFFAEISKSEKTCLMS